MKNLRGCARRNSRAQRDPVQIISIPLLIAKRMSSAVVRSPFVSMIWYLWNSTVRAEIARSAAISFAERPVTSNCRISLWRGVSDIAPSFSTRAPFAARFITSFVREGVMNVFPSKAARMASTNSSGAACLTTKAEAPASTHGARMPHSDASSKRRP